MQNEVPPSDQPVILLITVNDNETTALWDTFLGKGKHPEANTLDGVKYFDLGVIHGQKIIHCISQMGASGVGAAQQRTQQAIQAWAPQAVIAVGIAFGIDESKQKIGDVLVSRQLQDYELGRLNDDGTVTARGDKVMASDVLLQCVATANLAAIQSKERNWPKVRPGLLLCGQKLVDNVDYRNSLRQNFNEAVGGEMEGVGIYASAHQKKVDWIVVKAICDWGHSKNHAKKEQWQRKAAKNAARLVYQALRHSPTYGSSSGPSNGGRQLSSGSPVPNGDGDVRNMAQNSSWNQFLTQSPAPDYGTPLIEISSAGSTEAVFSPSLVYWPVKVRQPNIVHCAQSYVAAFLAQQGHDIRLCLDDLDLGNTYLDAEVNELKKHIHKWIQRVTSAEIANQIIERSSLLSDHFGREGIADKPPNDEALQRLGKNMVRWLIRENRLETVLKQSKLMDKTQADLEGKPRKLLSSVVVWTALDQIFKSGGDWSHCFALAGIDESSLWQTCPSKDELKVIRILLPKIEGKMDDGVMRPSNRNDIKTKIASTRSQRSRWLRYYLGWLPSTLRRQNSTAPASAAEAFDYFNGDTESCSQHIWTWYQ